MSVRAWLVLSLCIGVITWLYVHRILNPWTNYVEVHKGNVIAQMDDLYSPWVGTRELLLRRRNPYSPEVSHEIQTVFYGHPIEQSYEKSQLDIVNEQRFAYPVYVVFVMAPAVYLDFAEVKRWAPYALAVLSTLSVLLCLSISQWRLPWEGAAAIVVFTLSTPQIVQGLRHEQLAVVVGCLLTAGAWCVHKNRLATAGVLLALSTIKPQMALLPLCWFGMWAVGNWPKRWHVVAGFLFTLAALIVGGELILSGWPGYFLAGVAAYRKYAPTSSVLRMALGDAMGFIVGGLIVLVLLVYSWRSRKVAGDSQQFAFVLAAFFIVAILAFPLFSPFNQVMLILPAMSILQSWKTLSKLSRLIFIGIMSWPWIVSLALLLFPPDLTSLNRMPLLPSLWVSFVPLALPLFLMARQRRD